jgi:hypothetical protein
VAAAYGTVSGGYRNSASGNYAFIGGGQRNLACSSWATVGGGYSDSARGQYSTVGGGFRNVALGNYSLVAGGDQNLSDSDYAAVGGGSENSAKGGAATVAGGFQNAALRRRATIGGGSGNVVVGNFSTIGGGYQNEIAATHGSIAGGNVCRVYGNYGFATGDYSKVDSGHTNSAAFNGTITTASSQLRCGTLSKAGGSFTIDHPLDPAGTTLNHYFVEGPEMLNIYRGSVVLDAGGRAEVSLPDYFSALNRNPMVQLTGVGTSDVYLAEKVNGNRFVLGGKPGTEVYWQVTGERKDVSAEAIRRMMPVEQRKTGKLAGRSLDDDFLSGCMEQLVREGKAQGIDFRTAAGRQRYEDMKRFLSEERK